jgi:hypothetical protein
MYGMYGGEDLPDEVESLACHTTPNHEDVVEACASPERSILC